ncbi:ATP binding [Coemansia sp. RSA 2336]|nr:ATP binding [Coemansia sp. RSA 2336]
MKSPALRQHSQPADAPRRPEPSQRYTLQQVLQWNEGRVCQWVREQGFGKYEDAFRANLINGEALVELNYGLLKELEVKTVGERVRLNLAIRRLREQCLQVDISEPQVRGKRSATIDGTGSGMHMDMVTSPGPISAATSANTAVGPPDTGTFGAAAQQKNLPLLSRTSLSSNSIGLSDIAEVADNLPASRSANVHNGFLQRANTDMRSFSLKEHSSGANARKPQMLYGSSVTSVDGSQKSADASTKQGGLSLKTGASIASGFQASTEPMSAPVQRLRKLANTHRSPQQPSSKLASQKPKQGEEIERLEFQLQEFFGSDISVAHLADSLSVRTWQVTVTGPENQVRHVSIANTSSARAILQRVRRAFDLDNDADGEQYSLFSMTSEGGGARCLSNEELVKMFADPNKSPPEKFFLRKRHQLSRPPAGTKRSEHLQRAIERLGNIIPVPASPSSQQQQQQQQQQQPVLQRSMSKWESTTEKLTKILGERPPSELVSMNVEKYFPGNEARARHSIMRRRKNESMEAAGLDSLDSSLGRSSRRQSRSHRRGSSTSAKAMQARIRSVTVGSEDRSSAFSNSLEPIEESQPSPAPLPAESAPVKSKPTESAPAKPKPAEPALAKPKPTEPTPVETKGSGAETKQPTKNETEENKRQSKDVASSPPSPTGSCASLQFSDDDSQAGSDANNLGTLSDILSELSDGVDSYCSSFYESLSDSDLDTDLADFDSDQRQSIATDPDIASLSADKPAEEAAEERRQSVARSVSTVSRINRAKKKTWIKGALIASGSFGSVYFGMNTKTGAIMAVKEVDLPKPGTVSMTRNQKMADALRHELDLLKGLDHKNVVKYLGTDMDETKIYIFLEYVSGGSVSSALASYGMFPESLVRTYTAQIIEGLVYLHGQGIIHRDIKGGNVLIDQDGSVKISDFGISKRVDEVVAAAATKAGRRASLQGSVFWMAPEVVKDTHYTVKGDVWSLGCLVIEMMTGNHPFPDLDQMQALYTIGQRGRPQIPSDASSVARDFLEKALQVDLDARPTATDLISHEFVTEFEPPSP